MRYPRRGEEELRSETDLVVSPIEERFVHLTSSTPVEKPDLLEPGEVLIKYVQPGWNPGAN